MQDIATLERRITVALERIGRGLEGLSAAAVPAVAVDTTPDAETTNLTEALEEERMANAQLNERLRVVGEKSEHRKIEMTAQIAALTAQIADQAEELATLRATVARLTEEVQAGVADSSARPDIAAMQAELQNLRDARAVEAAELAEIVSALDPLIEEVSAHA
jgi:hypothetical protein